MIGDIIKRKIKKRIIGLFENRNSVWEAYFRKKVKNRAIVLAYHRVNTKKYINENVIKKPLYVSNENFNLQMEWLSKNTNIVRLSEVLNYIKKGIEWEDPLCAITFDDGWYDNYEFAFPILNKYNSPATIFMTGNNIGTTEPNCWDMCFEIVQNENKISKWNTGIKEINEILSKEFNDQYEKSRMVINMVRKLKLEEYEQFYEKVKRYYWKEVDTERIDDKYRTLSWANMNEMRKYKIDFGYHSKSHFMLTHVPIDRLEEEIKAPHDEGCKHGVKIEKIFSFPDGKYDQRIFEILKKLGYLGATILKSGFNDEKTDPFMIKRVNIQESSSSTINELIWNICIRGKNG